MIDKIISDICSLSDDTDILYMSYFSDSMTNSEKLRDIEKIEEKLSSILKDIQKYKNQTKKENEI